MTPPEKPGNYFVIEDWMTGKLGLKSNELIIYAIIHGFSQDGRSYFYGSISYLMIKTNLSKETVLTVLQSLVKKKLIVKKDVKNYQVFDNEKNAKGAQHFCLYYTAVSRAGISTGQESVPEENHGSENLTRAGQEFRPVAGQEFRPNTLLDTKFDTATSERQDSENPENKDSEKKHKFKILEKSKAAEGVVTKELKELFGGHLVFDSEFVPEIARLMAQFDIHKDKIPAYLRFVFRRSEEKKPNSLTNMYYKMAKSPNIVQDFLIESKKTETEEAKKIVCPVCETRFVPNFSESCPKCGFDKAKFTNAEEIQKYRRYMSLPEEKRRAYENELGNIYQLDFLALMRMDENERTDYKNKQKERESELDRKFGLSG